MPAETLGPKPDLVAAAEQRWYRGLSRHQWWVLIIASMGWMFDTMDQQFFNIGRGPAMKDVLDVDPIEPGVAKLGPKPLAHYSQADLMGLISQGVLRTEDMDPLLTGRDGQRKESVSRNAVATVIGERLLAPRYQELGSQQLKDRAVDGSTFDPSALEALAHRDVMSAGSVKEVIKQYPQGVSREQLAIYLGRQVAKAKSDVAGDEATSIFVFGWAIGGLIFGWIGDAIGRAKTMAITILLYSIFTGLNGLAETELSFNTLRFLTALGVGGEFAAGAALVAESMPDRSRAAALGTLQALSAFGNMTGALLGYFIMPTLGWRWLFFIGAVPGIVAVFVFLFLREPEKWKEARRKWLQERASGVTTKKSSYAGLFEDSRWRKRAIIGLLLGVAGIGALWGVGFFKPELDRLIGDKYGMSPEAKEQMVMIAFFLQNLGAFFGISAYTWIALKIGRRAGFAFFFVIAFFVVSYTFLFADSKLEAYILAPIVGFVTLGPFGGYAIYFPELFPTRLRATGVGFCYNVGRFLAALVPYMKSGLKSLFMTGALMIPFLPAATNNAELAIRYGSFVMIFIYVIGLVVLLFAPETKGQPLPED